MVLGEHVTTMILPLPQTVNIRVAASMKWLLDAMPDFANTRGNKQPRHGTTMLCLA